MPRRIVTDGLDPLTRPALEYLISEYGIDPSHINKIVLTSLYGDVQMITVTLLVQNEYGSAPLRRVPLLRPPMRDERPASEALLLGPTGDGDADLKAAAARLNQAHAPTSEPETTCVYMLDAFTGNQRPCGEVIRKVRGLIDISAHGHPDATMQGPWEWIHVSDGRLGTSAHPATPGY